MTRRLSGIALALIAAAGCSNQHDPSVIVASGHVEATDVRLSTKVAGTLEVFSLEEGDRLTAGQEIARLDFDLARAKPHGIEE